MPTGYVLGYIVTKLAYFSLVAVLLNPISRNSLGDA
jgi:hypothetical protein